MEDNGAKKQDEVYSSPAEGINLFWPLSSITQGTLKRWLEQGAGLISSIVAGSGITVAQSGGIVTVSLTTAAPSVTDIQIFTTPGTTNWTKPSGAKAVEVYVIGAGGGGGSGGRNSSPSGDTGGSGGGGGSLGFKKFNASGLGSTESLTVGAGGAGGASKGSNGSGNNGVDGGATTFGTTVLLKANGGGHGIGGNISLGGNPARGVGGIAGNGDYAFAGGDGGLGRQDDANGEAAADTSTLISPRGGGAGGGANASGNFKGGGNGGGFTTNFVLAGGLGASISNAGGAGVSALGYFMGAAGAGGGGGDSGPGGTGVYGSGGGGGGSDNTNSGTGGAGGDGVVIVITYF